MELRTAESSAAEALVRALSKVSANAVPGLVDAILSSTRCSSSALLLGLLQHFPDIYEPGHADPREITDATGRGDGNVTYAYLAAVLHLLKNGDGGAEDLLRAIWTTYVPLLRSRDPDLSNLQIQVAETLAEATLAQSGWDAVKEGLVPLCLNSLYPSFPLKRESTSEGELKRIIYSGWQNYEKEYNVVSSQTAQSFQEELLQISAVTQLLGALLTASLDASKAFTSEVHDEEKAERVLSCPQKFCEDMVSVFLAPALAGLTQPVDKSLRLCLMQNVLPPLLRSAAKYGWLEDASPEGRAVNNRTSPMQEVWLCCQVILSQASQRQDAFMAVALFTEFLLPSKQLSKRDACMMESLDFDQDRQFDVRGQVEFWEMLKKGLGDADSLTRKRTLHVLKRALSDFKSSRPYHIKQETNTSSSRKIRFEKTNAMVPKQSYATKRNKWAEEEASSLGMKGGVTHGDEWSQRWDAFVLLHETLEEYGVHLVEAAWRHQMSLLLQFTKSKGDSKDSGPYWVNKWSREKSCDVDINFSWLCILWQRGFNHKNPQVRRLLMQSFLEFEWERIRKLSSLLPEDFVLGTLLQAVMDPAQHRDFGIKGKYSSATADGAARFLNLYSSSLPPRGRVGFVIRLTKAHLSQPQTRPGLMTFTMCLEAATTASSLRKSGLTDTIKKQILQSDYAEILHSDDSPVVLLEPLKSVVDNSKRHYNPKYREKVCSHIIGAVSAVVVLPSVPFKRFAYFLSSFPKELLIYGGSLHTQLLSWIHSLVETNVNKWMVGGLHDLVELYLRQPKSLSCVTDDDVEAWTLEAGRCARLLVFGLIDGNAVSGILSFIQEHVLQLLGQSCGANCTPLRSLLLIKGLLKECSFPKDCPLGSVALEGDRGKRQEHSEAADKRLVVLAASVSSMVLSIMEDVKDFASRSAAIFWEQEHDGRAVLPASVSGKLGGPSQRRLPADLTSAALKAVVSISTITDCCLWCRSVGLEAGIPESVSNFLWQYAWTVATLPCVTNEVNAELRLAAYEALTYVCSALAATAHPFYVTAAHASMTSSDILSSLLPLKADFMLDGLIRALLPNVGAVIAVLARSRQSVLTKHKWSCMDSLLSIPKRAVSDQEGDKHSSPVSNSLLEDLLQDSIDSLECAGEEYLLPLLRCVRWLIQWGVLGKMDLDGDPGKKYQVMWTLVQSGWSAMVDVNKRRVGPTAAFLSALFHTAVFGDQEMHRSTEDEEEHGPLKWLLNRLIEQGSRSPRTMRLTALHITGLWLMFPGVAALYIPELIVLALHGGESVDEELDGEIVENKISAREYASLIKSSDPELTEEFTNSEMYVRVLVAVMVHELATVVEDEVKGDKLGLRRVTQAIDFGHTFLLELLHAAATRPDLCKELYKKKSAIHRRKVRAWQLLCILSRFLDAANVDKVTPLLKECLYRNNMPSVRQYIEAFAVQFYLRFPQLAEESLIPILEDYNMRTQALASYVLVATNVLMFTPVPHQRTLLYQILPAILPLMTSHHHSLRSFTQIFVHKILQRFAKSEDLFTDCRGAQGLCLQSIADYLEANAECARLRASINLDAFDPLSMSLPRGIFCNRVGEEDPSRSPEDHPFECVPVAVLDQVGHFLSEAREELRESMLTDTLRLNAERFSGLLAGGGTTDHSNESWTSHSVSDMTSQRRSTWEKTPSEHDDPLPRESGRFLPNENMDIQKKIASLRSTEASTANNFDDELLLSSIESRAKEVIRMIGDRQDLIVVASLLDRIPNLAGLARTCEVFKASSLVVADAKVAQDRQFQLISVTADQWVPLVEIPEAALRNYLNVKRREGYSLLGLEQTANSVSIDKYVFPKKTVLVLGREALGIPVEIIQVLDTCLQIPQLGFIRSLNVHVSGAIAIWEYTRQHLNTALGPGSEL